MASYYESLDMTIARRRADEYEEIVIKESDEACNCKDCEASLKVGIEAYDWIIDADERYRSGLFSGSHSYNEELERVLEFLMRRWQGKCEGILKWAEHHVGLGFDVAHLSEFKKRCEMSRAVVRSFDETSENSIMSEPLIILRDQALEDHRNGQTAEFV